MRSALAAILACVPLSGCWFVFIPGALIQHVSDGITGAEGEHCVNPTVSVGDRITINSSGQAATVISLSGTSVRCKDSARPIRARLQIDGATT